MKRSTGKQLRRLAAITLAAGMMTGAAMPVWAAEPTKPSFAGETKSIDSADQTMDQEAVVWATVTGEALKQLKVTLPIRLDVVVFKDASGGGGSSEPQFLCGDYEIRVDGNSEVGVKLDNVKVVVPSGSKWDLVAEADLTTETDYHKVAMSLADTPLKKGDNKIADFTVDVGGYKSLGMDGKPAAKTNIQGAGAAAERAFQVTYTISQYTAPTT